MAVIFGFFATTDVDGAVSLVGAAGPIALVAANLFVIAFGMSWGPVVWVLLGEMFPNPDPGGGAGSGGVGAVGGQRHHHHDVPRRSVLGAYGFYAVCAALSFVFVWRFVRETKGSRWRTCTPRRSTSAPDDIGRGRSPTHRTERGSTVRRLTPTLMWAAAVLVTATLAAGCGHRRPRERGLPVRNDWCPRAPPPRPPRTSTGP